MKHFVTLLCIIVILPLSVFAQNIVDVPSDEPGTTGNLNEAIAAHIGDLSNTVFNLEPYGYYVLSELIIIPLNEHLQITAPDPGPTQLESPPQILWTVDDLVDKDFMFECFGDLSIKNVWLRYADEGGVQVSSQIRFIGDTLGTAQIRGNFENVIFDYSACPQLGSGGSVTIAANHFVGHFKNCYWKNCIDTHLRYYGRAVSFPYQSTKWHIDSLSFENCTFANMGYVYMQEEGEYADNVHFNHCTFLNVMMFSLESGWWYKMFVTNSLFVNTYMYGKRPLDGEDVSSAVASIDSIANWPVQVPFGEQDRRILFANNSYGIQPWLVDWMANCPWSVYLHQQRRDDEIPEPCPMFNNGTREFLDSGDFPYMNAINQDSGVVPGFITPTTNVDSLKHFVNCKWDDANCDGNWSWEPNDGWYQTWPLNEDLSYTNETLKAAAMGGFPLGDLYRWWPTEYGQWQAQSEAEYDQIYDWLENGITSIEEISGNSIPSKYVLNQNYPNPFNPTTNIEYSIPISGQVSLTVYNSLGQEVAILFNGYQQVGNYKATFNGNGLPSGIYMYRLESGNVSITKKFILLK